VKSFDPHASTDTAKVVFLPRCQIKEAFRVFSRSLVSFGDLWEIRFQGLKSLVECSGYGLCVCLCVCVGGPSSPAISIEDSERSVPCLLAYNNPGEAF
jgi:hypothetical protein